MGYHHKRSECSKGAREILENVLRAKQAVYELIESVKAVSVEGSAQLLLREGEAANVFSSTTDRDLAVTEESTEAAAPRFSSADGLGTEIYKNALDTAVRIPRAKETYKKRRGKGNRLVGYKDYYEL